MAPLIYNYLKGSYISVVNVSNEPFWGYSLIRIRASVLSGFKLPAGFRIRLWGYDLILDNPSPVYIRFSQGYYFIGSYAIPINNEQQIIEMLLYTIINAVPAAIHAKKEITENEKKEFSKFIRLKAINDVAEQIRQSKNIRYGYQY